MWERFVNPQRLQSDSGDSNERRGNFRRIYQMAKAPTLLELNRNVTHRVVGEVTDIGCGVFNFMSWNRLINDFLEREYPDSNITGLRVSVDGLEIQLERK